MGLIWFQRPLPAVTLRLPPWPPTIQRISFVTAPLSQMLQGGRILTNFQGTLHRMFTFICYNYLGDNRLRFLR